MGTPETRTSGNPAAMAAFFIVIRGILRHILVIIKNYRREFL